MFSENDMQELLEIVRQWVTSVDSNADMTARAHKLRGYMQEVVSKTQER